MMIVSTSAVAALFYEIHDIVKHFIVPARSLDRDVLVDLFFRDSSYCKLKLPSKPSFWATNLFLPNKSFKKEAYSDFRLFCYALDIL